MLILGACSEAIRFRGKISRTRTSKGESPLEDADLFSLENNNSKDRPCGVESRAISEASISVFAPVDEVCALQTARVASGKGHQFGFSASKMISKRQGRSFLAASGKRKPQTATTDIQTEALGEEWPGFSLARRAKAQTVALSQWSAAPQT